MKIPNDKKTVVTLLVGVIVVWGMIIYRLAAYTRGDAVVSPAGETIALPPVKTGDSLGLNYRDPFLAVPHHRAHLPGGSSGRRKIVDDIPDIPPSFRFAGTIRKGRQKSLLIVSGEETRLISVRTKTIDGYRIEKIYTDSLLVSRGKHKYMLRMDY